MIYKQTFSYQGFHFYTLEPCSKSLTLGERKKGLETERLFFVRLKQTNRTDHTRLKRKSHTWVLFIMFSVS